MNMHLASHLRKIQLSRSEPVIGQNKVRNRSPENKFTTRCYSRTESPPASPLARSVTRTPTPQQHYPRPPTHSRPNLTVVSPKRRIRLNDKAIGSLYDLRRSSADGESSSQYSDDEADKEDFLITPRLPGDGISSDESDSTDESVVQKHDLTGNSEEFQMIEDDQDDGYMEIETDGSDFELDEATSTSSSFNNASGRTSSLSTSSPQLRLQFSNCSLKDTAPLPLLQSLFLNIPPTLYFTIEGEEISQLPIEVRRVMKWKQSTVTPRVVKACIARTGFRVAKSKKFDVPLEKGTSQDVDRQISESSNWLGVWGKHMKSLAFKNIKEYQKVNHFPGSFHIGRKDKLWKSFQRMKITYGKKEFYFLPQTFILPQDTTILRKAWDDTVGRAKWIVKPPASARGSGIRVISKWSQIPKKRSVVVQRYVAKPYLINGRKFDLRIYVFVACYDPLRVYIFQDGLVRFATKKYSSSSKSLSNKFIHLTNYSINKRNVGVYTSTDEATGQEAHKW